MSRSVSSKSSWNKSSRKMIFMKWTSWAFLAFVGSLVFLVLFIKDWEVKRGVDRLSRMHVSPQSALDADPDLKLVSERSPYMRTER
jgi:hypothetical protein